MDDQDKKDVAEALVIWKLFRQKCGGWPTAVAEEAGYRALQLAGRLGVKDEFMAVLRETPVMNLQIKVLEK